MQDRSLDLLASSPARYHCTTDASAPMQRIHMDYLEIEGQSFHLIIDSYSKWMEVYPMNSTTSRDTVSTIQHMIASIGLPDRIISDKGPQYTSQEFKTLTQRKGILHTLTPPYHPWSNGQGEISVKTFKSMFKKLKNSNMSLKEKVDEVLRVYRNIPHSTTGKIHLNYS